FAILALLAGLFICLTLSGCTLPGARGHIEKDFSFTGTDGQSHKVSDYANKPLVLNFWADWCPPCVGEMPHFAEVFNEKGTQFNLVSVAVSSSGSPQAFASSNGYNWTFGQDTTDEGSKLYGITAIPATYFYDRTGKLVDQAVGGMDKSDF